MPDSGHGIYSRRFPRGQVACYERSAEENRHHGSGRPWIARLDSEKT